ncbi:hypothetical protein NE237_026649 [Protea cynaroides]|uniref:Uncharacterized protein n=1 Tax=Protea cynaroides TaxID=273540 RepID=A0A9Q0K2X9_9MAGN|nr:hypothetical protein NE237_026649 [Protea cynaroides]
MAHSKLLVLSIFLALIFTKTTADAEVHNENIASEVSDSSLKIELEQFKSKISVLESDIGEKTQQLNRKDESMGQMEKTIQEKSDSIVLLESEIVLLQKKGTVEAEEQMGKVHARAGELANQVEKLKRELEVQNRNKKALEARRSEAEKKIDVLNMKLENLQKINDEQKIRIRKTEHALQAAEEEMMKAKLVVNSMNEELMEVHGAWLPPRLAAHLVYFQSIAAEHWNKHGKPAMDIVVKKALEKKCQAHKWAEPHIETVVTRWIPTLKERWLIITAYLEPYSQLVTKRSIELYETSKSAIAPYVVKVQEFTDPFFQDAKKFTKPYIEQVAIAAKPHVDRARVALKPYTKKAVHSCDKFLQSASTYHHQVQDSVRETLKKHELTSPFATNELVWFAASALLALPVILLIRLFSATFCKKAKKPARNGNASHTRHSNSSSGRKSSASTLVKYYLFPWKP